MALVLASSGMELLLVRRPKHRSPCRTLHPISVKSRQVPLQTKCQAPEVSSTQRGCGNPAGLSSLLNVYRMLFHLSRVLCTAHMLTHLPSPQLVWLHEQTHRWARLKAPVVYPCDLCFLHHYLSQLSYRTVDLFLQKVSQGSSNQYTETLVSARNLRDSSLIIC